MSYIYTNVLYSILILHSIEYINYVYVLLLLFTPYYNKLLYPYLC